MTRDQVVDAITNILYSASDNNSCRDTAEEIVKFLDDNKILPIRRGIDPSKMEWFERQEWDPKELQYE